MVQSAARANVESFVQLSSATVYGAHADQHEPLSEASPLRPNRGFVYAEHKVAAEVIVEQFRRQDAFRAITVLRPSFVVGPGSRNALFRHISRRFAVLPGAQSPATDTHQGSGRDHPQSHSSHGGRSLQCRCRKRAHGIADDGATSQLLAYRAVSDTASARCGGLEDATLLTDGGASRSNPTAASSLASAD